MIPDGSTALEDLAHRYGLSDIYVFGSQAKETVSYFKGNLNPRLNPEADADIGVQPFCDRRLSARDRVEITQKFEDLLKVHRVDLVVLAEAGPFLALDIIKGELLYCADPDRQAEDELYVLRRAGDLAYFEKKRRKLILEGDDR